MSTNPLILTLAIDTSSFRYFNSLRIKYFPADRNFIDAHVTLFHSLPYSQKIFNTVEEISSQQKVFIVHVAKPMSIGKGVAFKLECEDLIRIHRVLQNHWIEFLTRQDKQKIWPHITVQNKVSSQEAQNLLAELEKDFQPSLVIAKGLQLWEYLGGPWKLNKEYFFKET